ncbi:hypothetical protein AGLY_004544, partial [Aphis glycines]
VLTCKEVLDSSASAKFLTPLQVIWVLCNPKRTKFLLFFNGISIALAVESSKHLTNILNTLDSSYYSRQLKLLEENFDSQCFHKHHFHLNNFHPILCSLLPILLNILTENKFTFKIHYFSNYNYYLPFLICFNIYSFKLNSFKYFFKALPVDIEYNGLVLCLSHDSLYLAVNTLRLMYVFLELERKHEGPTGTFDRESVSKLLGNDLDFHSVITVVGQSVGFMVLCNKSRSRSSSAYFRLI